VHLAASGCPVRGDPIYGHADRGLPDGPRLHLHARAIAVPLYANRPSIAVTAPPPGHMLEVLIACGLELPSMVVEPGCGKT
jgi:tRNA pseudouridine32 synthase/23S rRNA pseudouridine746 synthase